MKFLRSASFFMVMLLVVSILFTPALAEEETPAPPEVEAKAALLLELNSNTVLFEKNADTRVFPASLTKIMSCLVALENSSLTDSVTVSENAYAGLDQFSSTAGLLPGEILTMENLLYCMMISSGNEACNIVAEYISGGNDGFVQLMNDRAASLGCRDTHFVNPHGLHDENHYTTARDLAIIAREAMKNNTFRAIVSSYTYTVPPTNLSGARTLTTTNSLMIPTSNNRYYDKRVNGVKTGFTTPAGRCLVASAQEDTISLLSVVCGCETRILPTGDLEFGSFPETRKLLDFGFSNYTYQTILTTLYPLDEIKVLNSAGADYVALAPREEITVLLPSDLKIDEIEIVTALLDENGVSAPIAAGQELGTVNLMYHGQLIGSTPLIAINSVEKASSILPLPKPQDPEAPTEENPDSGITMQTPTEMDQWLLILVVLIVVLASMMMIVIITHKSRVRRLRRQRENEKAGYR